MSRKPSKTIEEKIYEAKLKVIEAKEAYETQLYFETMPKIDPTYKYCYATSNATIPFKNQSVDAWLRAVKKHMSLRPVGHGGLGTDALIITVYRGLGVKEESIWIDYVTRKLRKYNKRAVGKEK